MSRLTKLGELLDDERPWVKRVKAAGAVAAALVGIIALLAVIFVPIKEWLTRGPDDAIVAACNQMAVAYAASIPAITLPDETPETAVFNAAVRDVGQLSSRSGNEHLEALGSLLQYDVELIRHTSGHELDIRLYQVVAEMYEYEFACRRAGVEINYTDRNYEADMDVGDYEACFAFFVAFSATKSMNDYIEQGNQEYAQRVESVIAEIGAHLPELALHAKSPDVKTAVDSFGLLFAQPGGWLADGTEDALVDSSVQSVMACVNAGYHVDVDRSILVLRPTGGSAG